MESRAVILFDGVCGFCDRWVSFVLKHDRKAHFQFAALQSDAGRALLRSHSLRDDQLDTLVVIAGDRVYTRSSAVLTILQHLGWPWSAGAVGRIIPVALRDAAYRIFARHRYRWFGFTETCRLPSPSERSRFIG